MGEKTKKPVGRAGARKYKISKEVIRRIKERKNQTHGSREESKET